MREIVLDTETTGFEPTEGHRIVEIGAVELKHGLRTGEYFHAYINPERSMPRAAYEVHGISEEFLKDKPLFKDVAKGFAEFLGEDNLVIHNAKFDMKFINFEFQQVGLPIIPMQRAIDTVLIARKKFPGSPANLDALCKRFAIDLSQRTKHGALLDAELLSDVYIELLGGRQVKMEFNSKKVITEKSTLKNAQFTKRVSRKFTITEEDKINHQEFLKKLKNPLWLGN